MTPLGRGDVVVIESGAGAIVIDNGLVAVWGGEPLSTRTVKLNVPAAVGVPLMPPDGGDNTSPVGKFPVTDQVRVGAPPVEESV